jgi:glyceraldehyde 3-phosphate dehydrogenase
MALRYGINGMGRIGRALVRVARERPELELAAVNDLVPPAPLARLLARDSVHGPFAGTVSAGEDWLRVDGRRVRAWQQPDPARVEWDAAGVEAVVEATGRFLGRRRAAGHLGAAGSTAGVRWVVLSANPDPDDLADVTLCQGVNDADLDPAHHAVISNGSCTTNCLALVAKVLRESFGLRGGLATVVHSYTESQRLLDAAHPDPRRARAAAQNIIPIPTTTPRTLGLVLPELAGRISGFVVRVPSPMAAMLDLSAELGRAADPEEVRQAFRAAAAGPRGALLGVAEEELVSSDFIGDPRSGVIDLPLIATVDRLVRVVAWYDNEWGYANRLADLLVRLAGVSRAASSPAPAATAAPAPAIHGREPAR